MKRHIPSLHALRAFEATARLLSFQQAAKELNVTHSAVSHQIKKLVRLIDQMPFVCMGRHGNLLSQKPDSLGRGAAEFVQMCLTRRPQPGKIIAGQVT